ncbi:MAG: hypothetical protein COU29_00960 [Candidatus Magasanikbacteria bacterium CG10_big_fil_rev_8_21_14_0_10_36_32]|uniref:Glycosyl hydrolase family 32 N-terminal domain-containing protein n=1 Tax=Candidatus Magasanikbacteria bacterium CG10_big_fil_rev_8_21_14_0_10_36_32 TaxID=1974646 RepID=A0A2M6W6E3_9BACT|nr:MAG: hypothetical protein COU29_00960 [Candidatus Magasanikbacteria bacterium CG10_big_fil_rev_8_21_14_0_10_36_32]
MKKILLIFIILILFVFLLLVLFWKIEYNPLAGFSRWNLEGTVIENQQDTNQNPDIIQLSNNCFRLYSHGTGTGSDGLMNIYSYKSCNGLNWEFEGERIHRAAMPAAILEDDGKIRLYFQRGFENDKQQALMMAISDDGLNFEVEKMPLLVTGQGELEGIKTIAHFEIIKLDKGYRMYFDEGGLVPSDFEKYKNENWTWPVWRIRSLYSEDGLNWVLDTGVRIDYEQEPLKYMQRAGSCAVIKEGNLYHMYFVAGFSPWEDLKQWRRWSWSGIYEAISENGLDWKIVDKNIFDKGTDPKILRMGDEIRIYISEGHREGGNSIDSYLKK